MLGLFFLLLSIAAGWSIIRRTTLRLRRLEALSMSVAVGMSLSAWTIFLCAKLLGFHNGLPLGLAILTLLVIGNWVLPKRSKLETKPYTKKYRPIAFILAAAVVFAVVQLILLSYQFPTKDGNWMSNGNAWGDAPLHVTYVTQFSQGNAVDLISPNYLRKPLTYPFMADFYSAILRRLGSSWTFAMTAPSVVMTLALLYLLFSFGYRLLGSARASWLSVLFLVFSGALSSAILLTKVLLEKGIDGYHSFIGVSIPFATGDNYLNFFHSHIIPQRSYMFGMPLFIVIATILLETYRSSRRRGGITARELVSWTKLRSQVDSALKRREFWGPGAVAAGIMIGMMPLVHVHSLMILIGLVGLAVVGLLIAGKPIPKPWIGAVLVGIFLAAPQLIWQVHNTDSGHFTQWIAGWTVKNFAEDSNINWAGFWVSQIGFLFFTMILGWAWLKQHRAKQEIWLFYIAGIAIFAICNIFVFQPNVWDNMKLFEYGFWFEMMITGYILAIWSRQKRVRLAVPPIILSLVLMGIYTLVLSGPKLSFELLSKDEVTFGQDMQAALPADAYVLISNRHNHPITMLSGHKVMMTYSGWFNLYDGNWMTTLSDRDQMLAGSPQTPALITKYGVTHAIFSDAEVADGSANLEYYRTHFAVLTYQSGWWVFDLRSPL